MKTPTQKKIDLKTDKLKNKGVRKRNLNNIYLMSEKEKAKNK